MWWKLTGLAFVEAILVWWLTKPKPTHAVMYDPAREPAPPALHLSLALQIAAYAAMLAIILIPVLAFWIYRRASQP